MYKLLIIDDEEDICRAIAALVDWNKLGICLIGICLDGVEGYHMILDEAPDIVLTDIEMPGISGLDLIERISATNLQTEFVILSGYDQFEYAKRAMKCGVRHYLLKPCDEEQILDCMAQVIVELQKKEAGGTMGIFDRGELAEMQQQLIYNVIREGIYLPELHPDFFESYNHYTALSQTSYQLCTLYFLEQKNLQDGIWQIEQYFSRMYPNMILYQIYVNNVLLLFFPGIRSGLHQLDHFLGNLSFPVQTASIEYTRTGYPDLYHLLNELIPRLRRFDTLYFVSKSGALIPNYNHENIFSQINKLIPGLLSVCADERDKAYVQLEAVLALPDKRDFLLQLSNNLLITLVTQKSVGTMWDISYFLYDLPKKETLKEMREAVLEKTKYLLSSYNPSVSQYSPFIKDLVDYLYKHLDDQNLTLKWIADHYLYMNVNYVGKRFQKETGQKFSNYLVEMRVQRAKELFLTKKDIKIQDVAQMVGCGNNPYYFTKIFKKVTGMTPSAFIHKNESDEKNLE